MPPNNVHNIAAACSTFDVWNNMLRIRSHGLTLHKFVGHPPAVVLDLGCGNGYWAIEAAKAWPTSIFIGFDARDIQPKLLHPLTRKHHLDIAHRVKWVHGNLLDGLPFHCNYFDFVRVANIGLGVPENKWRYILEEIARVLKPGGMIEVIEEVPIFPCQVQRPLLGACHKDSSMTLVNRSPSVLPLTIPAQSSSPSFSSVTLDERCEPNAPTYPTDLSPPTKPFPVHQFPPNHPYLSHASSTSVRPSTPQDRSSDLQDHSRLRAAWVAMLSSRSIAVDILSVLPFHLKHFFSHVQSMPPVQVLLPPNSKIDPSSPVRSSFLNGTMFPKPSSPPALVRSCSASTCSSGWDTATLTPSTLSRSSSGESIGPYTTEFAQMHLASTVHTVAGYKEAIWQEYKKLYDVKVAKVVSPNANAPSGHTASSGPGNVKSSIRESFDDEWQAWHNDMTDRIGMRTLMSQLSWDEPPGQRPDWHVWRAKVKQSNGSQEPSDDLPFAGKSPALCRSIHGFIGWKRQP